MRETAFVADRRAISTTVSFTLATGITVILVAGLLLSFGAVMEGQETRAVDSELATTAEGLSVDLEGIARQAEGLDDDDRLAMRIEAPQRIAGEFYTIDLVAGSTDRLTVQTDDRTQSVSLTVPDGTTIESSTVSGGTVWIVAEGSTVSIQEDPP